MVKSFLWQKKYRLLAIIAICLAGCIVVLYAAKLLHTLQVSDSGTLHFNEAQMKKVRGTINQVQNQLTSGESAFVFIEELDKLKLPGSDQGLGLVRINHPQPYTDIQQWKEQTGKAFARFKIPTRLPEGFTFNRGELEYPMGILDAANNKKYYAMLKKIAAESKDNMAWQKAVAEDKVSNQDFSEVPRLLYTNRNNEQIEVSYMIIPAEGKQVKHLRIKDAAALVKLKVDGFEGDYTINNHNYLSETGIMRDIQWTEPSEGKAIQYHVSTPSMNVSKEDLLVVAANMK
jgi:phage-related protein